MASGRERLDAFTLPVRFVTSDTAAPQSTRVRHTQQQQQGRDQSPVGVAPTGSICVSQQYGSSNAAGTATAGEAAAGEAVPVPGGDANISRSRDAASADQALQGQAAAAGQRPAAATRAQPEPNSSTHRVFSPDA